MEEMLIDGSSALNPSEFGIPFLYGRNVTFFIPNAFTVSICFVFLRITQTQSVVTEINTIWKNCWLSGIQAITRADCTSQTKNFKMRFLSLK